MRIGKEWSLRRALAVTTAIVAIGAMAGCSKSKESTSESSTTSADNGATTTTATETTNTTGTETAAAAPAAAAPAADNVDTESGVKFADYHGDAAAGKTVFMVCSTCHSIEAGQNRIGPSLHGVVGRHSGTVPGFTYSAANKDSGIVWTEAKLFQYLEDPQHVIPGTKMTYTGVKDPQKRADVIAYLKSNS